MRIGIKIGSSLLTKEDNGINYPFLVHLCQQIAALSELGHEIFLVTSGAIKSDPEAARPNTLRAAVGMPRLMAKYIEYLGIYGIEAAQMLVVDRDLSQAGVFIEGIAEEAMSWMIIPIFNANDAVSDEESRNLVDLADNDRLFSRLCLLLRPQMAIMGFNQPCIQYQGQDVRVVDGHNYQQLYDYVSGGNSHTPGQDGAKVKLETGREIAKAGIGFILVPGQEQDFIIRAFDSLAAGTRSQFNFGTTFLFPTV